MSNLDIMLFLGKNEYATPQFLGRDGNILGRDCNFLRKSWLFQNLVFFLGRYCDFFKTSWQFYNLGQVGHVLKTSIVPKL